jgi:predicted amidophosphoribosyltransferase
MKPQKCSECGAEFRLGPASCPLCGAALVQLQGDAGKEPDPDVYRSNVRELREELKRLREQDAEAV